MAYALNLPAEVADIVYMCRDWKLEEVQRNGGTPSALAISELFACRPQVRRSSASLQESIDLMLAHPDSRDTSVLDALWEAHAAAVDVELEEMEVARNNMQEYLPSRLHTTLHGETSIFLMPLADA